MTTDRTILGRIASIDIFRALTMLLMIFVNDLWSLHNIPEWLKHTAADVDGMGLSDVVFPMFLFIVGLSIPHAIRSRLKKGENTLWVAVHILERSFALIVMGFFLVNFENLDRTLLPISKQVYEILLFCAFLLIWNLYPESGKIGKIPANWFRGAGILLLAFLAFIFKGGDEVNPVWMKPYWWGILGLIGWAYLISSFVYLFAHSRFWLVLLFTLIFCFLNFLEFSPWSEELNKFRLIISASNYSLVMCGVLASSILDKLSGQSRKEWLYIGILLLLAAIFIGYGFGVRSLGGISKIKATPSWTAICAGISYALYSLLFLIADKFHAKNWAELIAPAGKSTLTCYLVPYLVYPLLTIISWKWPDVISTGMVGLVKSLLFALAIVWITGLLNKIHIKLKI
jgi:heparan-alpha-glucosaminide N-acetyltransferase